MPRNGSDIYSIPPGTEGFPDTTIESEKYNNYIHDVETDLNLPRPVSMGGTGATSADGALVSLHAEKAGQQINNFDSDPWMAGSFYSLVGATAPPVAGHAFSGIAHITNANNMVVEAVDLTDPNNTPWMRVKTAGVWGAWIQGVSHAPIIVSDTPPVGPIDNSLWFESDTGLLYIRYNDGDTTQWTIACPQPDISTYASKTEVGDAHAALEAEDAALEANKVAKNGDTMTGLLTLSGEPTANLHAATKLYVDAGVGGVGGGLSAKVAKAGDTMTGPLILSGAPTVDLHATTKLYVDTAVGAMRVQRFSLAGVQFLDIPVPPGIGAVRYTCMLIMGGATALVPVIQASVSAGVFLTTNGQYLLNGFSHDNVVNPTAVSPLATVNGTGFALSGGHSTTSLPVISEGSILLKRPNTAVNFAAFTTAIASTTSTQTNHMWTYLTGAAAGSALSILALRVTSSGTHENFAGESFINMEWI